MRVLVVEDSDSIRHMIEALVSARGYAVNSVASGARALEEAFAWQPDVVLLDIDLAGTYDGIEVCTKLHAAPETRDLPVIVITASTDEEVKRRALDAGVSAFYEKPFSPLSVLELLESLGPRRR